jgi:cholesterol transport system auxiliary component
MVACAAGLALGACSVVKTPERPQWTTFVLEPKPAAGENEAPGGTDRESTHAPHGPVLRVAPIESGGGIDTPRMAYVRTPGTIEYFTRHRWAEPPSEMLAPLLVAALERTARFEAIIDPSSRAVGDASLEGELLSFRMEVGDGAGAGTSPRFRATMRASLVGSGDRRPLAPARTFDVLVPAPSEDAPGGASAASAAASQLADEIAAWCAELAAVVPLAPAKGDSNASGDPPAQGR